MNGPTLFVLYTFTITISNIVWKRQGKFTQLQEVICGFFLTSFQNFADAENCTFHLRVNAFIKSKR